MFVLVSMNKIDWMVVVSIILLIVFIAWIWQLESSDSITGEVISNFSDNVITGRAIVPLEEEYDGLIERYDDIENIQWDHMPVSYKFVENDVNSSGFCSGEKRGKIQMAMAMISNKTYGDVLFVETNLDADIDVFCREVDFDEFSIAEGEADYDFVGLEIVSGTLNFYDIVDWERDFDCLDLELHEILHVLGFEHSEDEESIMYFKNNGVCKNKIDEAILDKLVRIY